MNRSFRMSRSQLERLRDLLMLLYEDDDVDDTKRSAISQSRQAAQEVIEARW